MQKAFKGELVYRTHPVVLLLAREGLICISNKAFFMLTEQLKKVLK